MIILAIFQSLRKTVLSLPCHSEVVVAHPEISPFDGRYNVLIKYGTLALVTSSKMKLT